MRVAGLYSLKPWFTRRLRRIEDVAVAHGITADQLSIAAVVVSVVAGAAIAAGGYFEIHLLWAIVPFLGFARLTLNALDGSIARRTRSERPFGIVLNEIGDRLSDVALIGGTAIVVPAALSFGALSATLFTSSAGVLSVVVGGTRDSGGPMGKADRVAVLSASAAVAAITRDGQPFRFALWLIVAGTSVTAARRIARLRSEVA